MTKQNMDCGMQLCDDGMEKREYSRASNYNREMIHHLLLV
jgi:hypothetical protein